MHRCPSGHWFVSAIVGFFVVLFASPAMTSAGISLPQKDALINIMLCYGQGTDTIGDSTNPGKLAEGKAIYGECFTDDAVFSVWFPGTPFDGAPSIPPIVGPDEWADFVFLSFDGTYTFTQHTLSNFMVDVGGNKATLSAYLNAAHVVQDEIADTVQVTRVDVAHGTYTLELRKIKGKWLATSLSLTLIDFNPYFP